MKILKIIGIVIVSIITLIVLWWNYQFSWSVKYKLGDCLEYEGLVYVFDSEGPLFKGSYGMRQLIPPPDKSKFGHDLGTAIPRESVERKYKKVECPIERLTPQNVEYINNLLNK